MPIYFSYCYDTTFFFLQLYFAVELKISFSVATQLQDWNLSFQNFRDTEEIFRLFWLLLDTTEKPARSKYNKQLHEFELEFRKNQKPACYPFGH